MKQLKKNSFIVCFAMILCSLIFSFSEISVAEQTDANNCVSSCADKKQTCFNINPDRRMCEEEFQECVASCKSEGDSSSSSQQGEKPGKPVLE
jgi:hypothetical protein